MNPFDGTRLPHLSSQIFQSHPPGFRDVLLSELPDKGLRNGVPLQEQAVGTDHHTLLTPREHDIRPSLVRHEPRGISPDDGNDDMVCFVALEGVDVEYRVLPCESCIFEGVLNRVALGVIGSDDLEIFSFPDITLGHFYGCSHFPFVLSDQASGKNGEFEFWFVHTYGPTVTLLGLLPVAHVYEATAGESLDAVFGSQFRVVDFTRDKMSDHRRHSVYHGRVIEPVLSLGEKGGTYTGYRERQRCP